MRKLMVVAVLAGALTGVAADVTYTWTSGATSLGDGAVTIAYLSGNNITNLTVSPTDGGTITINGALTFADDATITLATSGTVAFASKVTTKGALALARGDDAYIVWTGSSAMTEAAPGTLVATGMTRDDVDFVALIPAANSADVRSPYTFISGPNVAGFYVFNRVTASYVYSARVQLTEKNGNLYVRCRTCLRSPRFGLYPDEEGSWAAEDLWNKWTKKDEPSERAYYGLEEDAPTLQNGEWLGNPSKLGLNKIILRRKGKTGKAKVCFAGGASFGGTTTIDAGVEAVLTPSTAQPVVLNKAIAGNGDFTVVPPPNVPNTETMLGYIPYQEWKVLARNRSLADMKKITGHMQGGSHNPLPGGIPGWCNGYFLKYSNETDTATCQFQLANSAKTYKYVSVQLKQEGADILIKGVGYGITPSSPKATPGDQERTTFTATTFISYWDEDQCKYTKTGYGICDVTAYFDETDENACCGGVSIDYDFNGGSLRGLVGGKFTIDGSGSDLPMYARVYSRDGFPYSGEVDVKGNSFLHLYVTNANNSTYVSGSSSKIILREGAILRSCNYNWQLGGNQELVLAGGKFVPFAAVLHVSFVTFSNAVLQAAHADAAPRFDATKEAACWRVIGNQASALTGGKVADIYGTSSAVNARSNNVAFRVNVADVTGTSEADFLLPGIGAATDRAVSGRASFAWFMFEKYGKGTLKMTDDAKDVRLESKLFGGTLLLAENDIMTNAVVLAGGNLALDAGKSNSLGNLTANENATLTVGAGGSLSFTSFTAGEGLKPRAITIDAPMDGNVLRFGTNNTALASGQLSYFRWVDNSTAPARRYCVTIDKDGYLRPCGTLIIMR